MTMFYFIFFYYDLFHSFSTYIFSATVQSTRDFCDFSKSLLLLNSVSLIHTWLPTLYSIVYHSRFMDSRERGTFSRWVWKLGKLILLWETPRSFFNQCSDYLEERRQMFFFRGSSYSFYIFIYLYFILIILHI